MYGAQTSMDGLYRLLSLFVAETFFFSFSFPCFSLSPSFSLSLSLSLKSKTVYPWFHDTLAFNAKNEKKEKEKTTDKETTSTTKFICQIGAHSFPLKRQFI